MSSVRYCLLSACSVLVLLTFSLQPLSAALSGVWSSLDPAPFPLRELAACWSAPLNRSGNMIGFINGIQRPVLTGPFADLTDVWMTTTTPTTSGLDWASTTATNDDTRYNGGAAFIAPTTLLTFGGSTSYSETTTPYYSADLGMTWTAGSESVPWPGSEGFPYCQAPLNGSILLIIDKVYWSADGLAAVWLSQSTALTFDESALATSIYRCVGMYDATSSLTSPTIIATGSQSVYTSHDFGVTWTQLASPPWPVRVSYGLLSDLDNVLYVVGGYSGDKFNGIGYADLWVSGDKGNSWTSVSVSGPVVQAWYGCWALHYISGASAPAIIMYTGRSANASSNNSVSSTSYLAPLLLTLSNTQSPPDGGSDNSATTAIVVVVVLLISFAIAGAALYYYREKLSYFKRDKGFNTSSTDSSTYGSNST